MLKGSRDRIETPFNSNFVVDDLILHNKFFLQSKIPDSRDSHEVQLISWSFFDIMTGI